MAKTFNEEKMQSALASVIRETGASGCVVICEKQDDQDPHVFESAESLFNLTLHRVVEHAAVMVATLTREAKCNPDHVLHHFVLVYLTRVMGLVEGPELTKTIMKEEKANG